MIWTEIKEIVPIQDADCRPVLPIIFSCDDCFAAPCGTAIASLLKVSDPAFFYDIIVLDTGITEANRVRLCALTDGLNHAEIRIRDVNSLLNDDGVHGPYSKAVYLSLYIPFLFRSHERVLYLDCDMIVLHDLSPLFQTVFNGEYIAATRDVGIAALSRGNAPLMYRNRCTSWRRYTARYLKMDERNYEQAINAGLMLYNIPAFVADGFSVLDGMERHICFGYLFVDQCIINLRFQGRIKYLHMRWNLQAQHWGPPRLISWFADEYREALRDPTVIHYITHKKPWACFDGAFREVFDSIARTTVWFNELQLRRINSMFFRWLNHAKPDIPDTCGSQPLFSIIMPVYNREQELRQSVRSIQLQTATDFELILVDDASTDRTVQIAKQLAAADPRIQLIQLPENAGPGPARNAGMRAARGIYIQFCDSDDYLPPVSLEAFAVKALEGQSDLIAGNLARWQSPLREARDCRGPWTIERDVDSENLLDLPELWSMLYFHRCIFRREFLLENGIEYQSLRRGEDPLFMAEVVSQARSFALIQDVVYLIHIRPRERSFCFQELHDEYSSHARIVNRMREAGFDEIACCYLPFSMLADHGSEEDCRTLAELLADVLKLYPADTLEQPYFQHPGRVSAGMRHDFLLAKNSTPEQLAELLQGGFFSTAIQQRNAELRQLRRRFGTLERRLAKIGLPLERLHRFKRALLEARIPVRRFVRRIRSAAFRRQINRFENWRNMGDDLPDLSGSTEEMRVER